MRFSGRFLPLVFFALSTSLLAQSKPVASQPDDGKNFKITGTAIYGEAYLSDFVIGGPELRLRQNSMDGPAIIGECTVGADCTLSLGLPALVNCFYCKGNSEGSFRGAVADLLKQDLTFKATGVVDSDGQATMHVNIAGTITGYQLLDQPGSTDCSVSSYNCVLGPAVFRLRISGHGTGEVQGIFPYSPTDVWLVGISMSFSGVAHVEEIR
jgi:hypothetical protein